jgi:hypothetical protein
MELHLDVVEAATDAVIDLNQASEDVGHWLAADGDENSWASC